MMTSLRYLAEKEDKGEGMSAVVQPVAPPEPPHRRARPEALREGVVLHGIRWQTYEALLADIHSGSVRMTYDRGELEIMAPSWRHGVGAKNLGRLVDVLADELEMDYKSGGMTTFRREDLARGLEPDDCFYFKNVSLILGKREINLTRDPPPDLAIEVDIESSVLNRLGIYAALGVPEIWRYDGEAIHVHVLGPDGTYETRSDSPTFPQVPLKKLVEFLDQAFGLDDRALMRSFREWVRQEVVPRRDKPARGSASS
jgi:Uma2 family endonuclease